MGKGPYRPLCCCEPRRAYLYSPMPESHSVPWVRFALSSTRPSLSVLLQTRLPQDLCRLSWGSRVPRQLLSAPCQSANFQSLWLPMWGLASKSQTCCFWDPQCSWLPQCLLTPNSHGSPGLPLSFYKHCDPGTICPVRCLLWPLAGCVHAGGVVALCALELANGPLH